MAEELVYLDNAATSWPKPPEVGEAMARFLRTSAGNPGRGGHTLARRAADTVEAVRERIGSMLNAPCAKRVVLTHGCTDSVNQAIHGVLRAATALPRDEKPHVVVTAAEHNAVLRTAHCYASTGQIDLDITPCDDRGFVDPKAIASRCSPRTALVCVTHASNAVGTIQDVRAITRLVRAASPDALVLVDAAQTAGHLPIDVQSDDIDLLAIAGHKGLRGPTGTGALFIGQRAYSDTCDGRRLFCLRRGGTGMKSPGLDMPPELPDAMEAGTSNAVGFAGLLAAMDTLNPGDHDIEMRLTAMILEGLAGIDRVRVLGIPGVRGRTPVVLFRVEDAPAREIADALDQQDSVCVRGGTHCAPLLHKALGNGEDGAVRASPSIWTTEQEIERFLAGLARIVSKSAGVLAR